MDGFFEFHRAPIGQRRMAADRIVKTFDVFDDGRVRLVPGAKRLTMNQFGLERGKETLHRRVVVTVAGPAHAWGPRLTAEAVLVDRTRILSASVRMMQAAHWRAAPPHGHLPGTQRQRRVQLSARLPADDAPRAQVQDGCQIQPTFGCGHVGQVAQPNLIRARRGKSPGSASWEPRASAD